MDVIEYKLGSNNPTLVSHAIWKVLETIKRKVESGESEHKISELKFLLSQCESQNGTVSITACQALVALTESGVLTVCSTLSTLTACLANAKHCGAIASAICNLLTLELKMWNSDNEYTCPFALKAPQHPLIIVLTHKTDSWRDVLSHVRTMMNHCKVGSVEHRVVTLLRPVFLYILCDPTLSLSESCRHHAWHLLIRAKGTTNLKIEVLQWLRWISAKSCIDTNTRILELAEIAAANKDKALCSALIPFIVSLGLEILRNDGDPRSNLDTISAILVHGDSDAGSILICLLAEMITISPSVYLLDIVTMATIIVEKYSCDPTVTRALIGATLQWMAYPSILSSDALDVAKQLINKILKMEAKKSKSDKLYTEKPFNRLRHIDGNVKFYTDMCICVESLSQENILEWLEKLSKAPAFVIYNFRLIVGGIFLENKDPTILLKACNILVEFGKSDGQVLSLVLHKLANTRDIEQTKCLLFTLPKLTRTKENVPIVMHTLKTLLNGGKPLNYLAIELYVQALSVEPRCHRYLQGALIQLSDSDRSWKSDVTCARAMKYICEKHSEHGAELVPLLSQTLNRCSNKNGSAASALALKGISALCVAGVTEICSTWRVLSPKMNKEKRLIVLRSLCEFFADIPNTPSQEGQDFDKLVVQVLTKLWEFAINSKDAELVESAFKALTAFKLESMPLSVLPIESRQPVEEENSCDIAETKAEELRSSIPANYWISMLKTINRSSLSVAGNFLIHFIQEELFSFRTGIYRWPHGEPVNFKYLSEKSPVREIGEHIRRYKSSDDIEKHRIVVECLRIFAHKYIKPLPPILWYNLEKAIEISDQTRKYGILLACHQAPISPSAKEFLEKYLTNFTNDLRAGNNEKLKDSLDLYEKMDDICRAVGSNVLSPFLDVTLNAMIEKANLDNENAVGNFDEAMRGLAKALRDEIIHNDNRSVLRNTLEKMIDRIDVNSKIFPSLVNATLELSVQQLERITLPSVWLQVTTEKLKKAIIIRAELVLKKSNEAPLTWMNEIIAASASTTAVHSCLFEQLIRILPQIRLEKTNASWTLDLMRRIGAVMVDCKEKNTIDTAIFLCEILFITIICLSATDCLLINDHSLVTSHNVRATLFPQAVASIVQTAHWKDIISHTMEWLNHMRTTPIPRMYKIVFHNALISMKNERYFDVMWTKYLSIGDPINV